MQMQMMNLAFKLQITFSLSIRRTYIQDFERICSRIRVNFILKNNTLTFDSEFYLQMKGTTMGTIFAPTYTYANLAMEYHKIKNYSIIRQSQALASKLFENFWFRYLDDCQILLKVNLIKPEHLLSIINQINNNIQLTMEKKVKQDYPFQILRQTKMVQRSGWIVITKQQTQNNMSHLRQTSPPTPLFNKYTVLFCKNNMCNC